MSARYENYATCANCGKRRGEHDDEDCPGGRTKFAPMYAASLTGAAPRSVLPSPTPASALSTQVAGDHYKKMKIQPVEYIHANNLPFIEGCIIKYASRWRDKGGIKDLEKIKHFADLLIELENRK